MKHYEVEILNYQNAEVLLNKVFYDEDAAYNEFRKYVKEYLNNGFIEELGIEKAYINVYKVVYIRGEKEPRYLILGGIY